MKRRLKNIPHILLMLNIRTNTGRSILRGIGAYVAGNTHWDCNLTSVQPGTADAVRNSSANGMIIQINSEQVAEAAARRRTPIVSVGSIVPPGIPSVYVDPAAIGSLAANHLVERGFRHFAYFACYERPLTVLRGEAFVQTIKSFGYSCEWSAFDRRREIHSRLERNQIMSWVKKLPKPVGIFTVGDQMARSIALACVNADIKVPDEVAVLGVENDELMCQMCKPELSSIESGVSAVGFEAGRLLQRMLEGKRVPMKTVLTPPMRVVTRESTDVITVEDDRVASAVHFIQDKLGEGANIKKLVEEMNISRRTLEHAFRQTLGRTIHGEVVRAQLQRVSQLLEGGQLSLAEIVGKCGMRHKSQLNNFVKKHTGMTPLEYRRTHQQKPL